MTRARTFCRDGLVGAAGGLDSSVLIDYDNDRDTWDPPGSVSARGCALTSLWYPIVVFKTGEAQSQIG